ncbi:MAG: hypothetical protein K2O93_06115 [Oscillospiraceae bacterium]|nr:hypothetical protein [Oscillospiraceae bacterium]
MAFANMVLTTEGMMLYAKAQQGKQLHITRVVVGDGVLAPGESMVNRSGLKSQWASFLIDHVHIDSASAAAEIVFTMSNDNLEEARYFRELGVVAEDPDTKEDKLYLYDYDGADAERIPSAHEGTKVFERIKLILRLENTPNVTFALSGNPLYLTSDDIDDEAEGPGVLWSSLKVAEVVRGKQDTITGAPGQIVGFDKDGNPEAQEAPKGITGLPGQTVGFDKDGNPIAVAAPHGLPAGGTEGQVLGKIGKEDGQAGWVDPPDTGVTSFKGRKGTAQPASGDYSVSQVTGAAPKESPVFTDSISMGRKSGSIVGAASVALGTNVEASSTYAFAEGFLSKASGLYSHAAGRETVASSVGAIAAGEGTVANGAYSVALGRNTVASNSNHVAIGIYNKVIGNYDVLTIGCGRSESSRANAFRVEDATGFAYAKQFLTSGADYAELFEWLDGNPDHQDRAGLFVTLQGDRIRPAFPDDDYILGIVSGSPSVVGDVYDDQWAGMFLTDIFGRPIYEDVDLPAELGPDGEEILPARTERRQKLNPAYDHTKKYLPRTQRPEWDAVGLLGKLVAVDDGTCVPDGWCTVGPGGIATASTERTKYWVMARLDESHILVMIL